VFFNTNLTYFKEFLLPLIFQTKQQIFVVQFFIDFEFFFKLFHKRKKISKEGGEK